MRCPIQSGVSHRWRFEVCDLWSTEVPRKGWTATGHLAPAIYSLDRLFLTWNSAFMAWEVEFTGQFETWWSSLQIAVHSGRKTGG
jgi:hypothetical protein